MKIIHHISMSYGPVRKAFQDAGVELQIHDNNLTKIAVCDVAEDDRQWETVEEVPKLGAALDSSDELAFRRVFCEARSMERRLSATRNKLSRTLLHRTGQELESVLQLDIPKLVPLQMDSKAFEYERCMFCDRKKYKHVTGFFPVPQATDFPFFKSVQYFGSGSGATRAVLPSNALYRRITEAALKGAEFFACEP